MPENNEEHYMAGPDQATMESVGISVHDCAELGQFRALCVASECAEPRCSGSPWPSHPKLLFRDVRRRFIMLVVAECPVPFL